MTHLRILAPVIVDYFTVPGVQLRDPAAYAAFWADAQDSASRLVAELAPAPAAPVLVAPEVRFEHTSETSALNRYRTIDDDAVGRPLHVLSGRLHPAHLPEAFTDEADPVRRGTREIDVRLYDHGLMVLEILVDVGDYLDAEAGEVERRLDVVQENAVCLGEELARVIVTRYLDPVLDLLRRSGDADVVAPRTPADDPQTADFGSPLWVTRSLVVDPAEPAADRIVRHWIKDVALPDAARPPADELLDGERDHLVRWLNYVFMDRVAAGAGMRPGDPYFDQWEALRYSQVFYGVVDRIDSRLSRILANSATADSRLELEQLRSELTALSRRAEMIILERQDLAKYLKRSVRLEHEAIMGYWDYVTLLEEPVKYKIDLCNQRLAELGARRTARSAMFTDIILLGIAMTSVLATALALTEFGRAVANDPEMAVYDFGRSSIVAWVAAQPADAILISSGVVSVLIVLIYLFFRRDHRA